MKSKTRSKNTIGVSATSSPLSVIKRLFRFYNNRIVFLALPLILLILLTGLDGASYYYSDKFNSLTADWVTNFKYGKEGVKTPDTEDSRQLVNNGMLNISGYPYISYGDPFYGYDGIWVGQVARNEQTWSASSTVPFGFEVMRRWCDLNHYNDDAPMGDDSEEPYKNWCDVGIWLVVDNGARNKDDAFNDYVYFAENMRQNEDLAGIPSKVGYFDGNQHDFQLGQVTNFFGNTVNLTNRAIYPLEWDYNPQDDVEPNSVTNTNTIGMRIVHNGSSVAFYINPDPRNRNNYPNEWLKVGEKPVIWNSGMKFMIGHNIRKSCTRNQDGRYDDLLVKSATDKSKASISPDRIPGTQEIQKFVYTLSNEILPENAGINMVRITKPDFCSWASTPLEDIIVKSHYRNDPEEQTLKTVWMDPDLFPAEDQVGIRTNKGQIILLLGSQIRHSDQPEHENIKVEFTFRQGDGPDKGEFSSWVEAVQPGNMPAELQGQYSTCGEQRTEGKCVIRRFPVIRNLVQKE
ncbi:MAG: hypothetical protein PHF84_05085 [bacterium]|nr:hypothetical protein [bacterium]